MRNRKFALGIKRKIFIFFWGAKNYFYSKIIYHWTMWQLQNLFNLRDKHLNLLANLETSKDIHFFFKILYQLIYLVFKETLVIGFPLIYEVIYHCGVLKTLLSLYPKHCTKRFAQAQTAAYSQVYLKFKLMLNCLILLDKS